MVIGQPGLTTAQQDALAQAVRTRLEAAGVDVAATTTSGEIRETQATLFDVIVVFLSTMAVLLGVVGGLGLTGTMTMNVVERAREIGVLRAVGASDRSVLTIFLVEGVLIGALSWAIGVVVSVPISKLLSDALGLVFADRPLSYSLLVRRRAALGRHRAGAGGRGQPAAVLASQPTRRARDSGLRVSDPRTHRPSPSQEQHRSMTRRTAHRRHRRRRRRGRRSGFLVGRPCGRAPQPPRPRRSDRCPSPTSSRPTPARCRSVMPSWPRRPVAAWWPRCWSPRVIAVTAGQPLLRLDTTRLDAQVAAAQAAVAAGDAQVSQAQANARAAAAQVTVADAGVDQAQKAADAADANRDGTPSGTTLRRAANAEVDRARAALRAARAQLTAAKRTADAADAGLAAAKADAVRSQAALTEVQAALADLTLEAPFAGIVASLDADVGETVSPGAPVARIADTGGWRFETIDLDEAAIGRLAEGAQATITVDAFPDVEIPATVTAISSFGESSAGDIVYVVTLEPSGDLPDGLRWNMTASAEIQAVP